MKEASSQNFQPVEIRRVPCEPSQIEVLPSPCAAFSQSLSVNSLHWRIRREPRDPKRFGRA